MFIENFWLFVIIVMCVGGILGFAFFSLRYRNSKRIQRLQEELEAKTEELENYRGDVGEHFLKTAELVDNLTQSYKAVYDHLEGSAYKLVGEEDFRKQIAERKQLQLEAFSGGGAARELGTGGAAAVVIDEEIAEDVSRDTARDNVRDAAKDTTQDVPRATSQDSAPTTPPPSARTAHQQGGPSTRHTGRTAPSSRPARVVHAEEVEDEVLSHS